jgi:hypothetical protein
VIQEYALDLALDVTGVDAVRNKTKEGPFQARKGEVKLITTIRIFASKMG